MQFIKKETYESVSNVAAEMIATHIREKPDAVIGLATGSTPIGLYQELIRRHREEGLDFSQVTTFNLDEYYGLAPDHPQSYHTYMQERLFAHINIPEENTHIPDGRPDDVTAYCRQYEDKIVAAGGIDIQILGIGTNGHIGFNEPADELEPYTHLVELAEATIEANARFFTDPDEVPRSAVTMGIASILKAREIVLLATGESKAAIVESLATSAITTQLPASLLHVHKDVRVVVDEAAGKRL